MKQGVCVGAFIQNNEEKFLVVKRSEKDEYLPGMWELPGGGIEIGESPQEGAQREVKEEVSLRVSVGKPLGVHTYIYDVGPEPIHRVEITFLCSIVGKSIVRLSEEHSEYKWISANEVTEIGFTDFMKEVITDSLASL